MGVAPADDFGQSANLLRALLHFLRQSQAPWERVFYDTFCGAASEDRLSASPQAHLYKGEAWDAFWALLAAHAPERPERLGHAYFTRGSPATMVYEDVTSLWAKIAEQDDWSGFETALADTELMRQALDTQPRAETTGQPEDGPP
jgi:hypothetical protein